MRYIPTRRDSAGAPRPPSVGRQNPDEKVYIEIYDDEQDYNRYILHSESAPFKSCPQKNPFCLSTNQSFCLLPRKYQDPNEKRQFSSTPMGYHHLSKFLQNIYNKAGIGKKVKTKKSGHLQSQGGKMMVLIALPQPKRQIIVGHRARYSINLKFLNFKISNSYYGGTSLA